jgi:hypothetical protein
LQRSCGYARKALDMGYWAYAPKMEYGAFGSDMEDAASNGLIP